MNILLDRFPRDTFIELESSLRDLGHKVPLFVLTHQSRSSDLNNDNTCFYDIDIARGLVTQNIPMVLERADIKEASRYEGIAINVFSRFSINQNKFSAQEMSSHYFELYNFWSYQVLKYEIHFCMQHYMPHDPSSFVLYLVLKSRGIPVVFVDVPHIFNKFRPLACSFENRDLLLTGDSNSLNIDLLTESFAYQKGLNSNSIEAIPKTIRFRHAGLKSSRIHGFIGRLLTICQKRRKIRGRISQLFSESRCSAGHFFKISRNAWRSPKSDFSAIHFYFFMKRIAFRLFLARKRYEAKCVSSVPEKYVYFAMSAQPEGTTLPAALEFRDVFFVLRILREAIPADVPILFKENPSVFEIRNPYLSAVGYRAPDFYRRLLEIPNIKFVSTLTSSHDLIKNSLLVATINGTAAIESVYFGISAITFGSNWYDKINGIHKYQSLSDLKDLYLEAEHGLPAVRPIESKLMIDKDMLIQFENHNAYEFRGDARKQLIRAFIASIDKFFRLDDRKWSI